MSNPLDVPLTIPPWQIPYLEKHRIYELFHELTRELVIQQPEDHLMFLKQILTKAAQSRDVTRIIILSSPKVNSLDIAMEISKITHQVVISEYTLLRVLEKTQLSEVNAKALARGLYYLIKTENAHRNGWIVLDCIYSGEQATAVIEHGILPTHVFHLIPSFYPNINEITYCNVSDNWPDYRRRIYQIRNIFNKVLREIHMKQKPITEIVQQIVNILKDKRGPNFIKPRVILIGPRGSGRKTLAQMLNQNLNLVHVNFEELLCQAWKAESDLGTQLRNCKSEVCFHSELLSQVINKRILEDDCLENGWVLTGYPYTATDLKYLDSLDTPPSRIIFLDMDVNICLERTRHTRMNVYTGSVTDIEANPEAAEEKELRIHPKNDAKIIAAELKYYCENYGALRKYCGDTAFVVNGDQSARCVYDTITSILVKSLPPEACRTGLEEVETPTTASCGCIPVPTEVTTCFIKTT